MPDKEPCSWVASVFYAMKVVDREALAIRKKLQRVDMKKDILCMLDHPFLPTLYIKFEASHYSCLVMESCPSGIHCKEVTEIDGVPSMSKTQLGIQIAINVQIPHDFGGRGRPLNGFWSGGP